MKGLTRATWQSAVEAMAGEVLDAAATNHYDSHERLTLDCERDLLRQMLIEVRSVPPCERRQFRSLVLAATVREPLSIPEELVSNLAYLFRFYRRNRERLEWRESIPPPG